MKRKCCYWEVARIRYAGQKKIHNYSNLAFLMLGIYWDVSRIFWASRSILCTHLKEKNIFLQTIQHSLTQIKSGNTKEEQTNNKKHQQFGIHTEYVATFSLKRNLFFYVMCRERNLRERGFVILSVSQPTG